MQLTAGAVRPTLASRSSAVRVVACARQAGLWVSTPRQTARPLVRAPIRQRDVATTGATAADPVVSTTDDVQVPTIDKLSYSEQVSTSCRRYYQQSEITVDSQGVCRSTMTSACLDEVLSNNALQYDDVFSKPLVTNKAIQKPNKDAQAEQPNATKVFGSDVHAVQKRRLWSNRKWDKVDK